MRTGKRTLAGLAAGALVAGLVPFAVVATATSASAAPFTGTTGPIRAGTVGTIPAAVLAFSKTAQKPTQLQVVGSPASAVVTLSQLTGGIDQPTAADDSASLGTIDTITTVNFEQTAGDDSIVGISVNTAGTYTVRLGNGTDTVTTAFTTAGAPASVTLTPTSRTILVGASAALDVTIKDSLGNTTQPAIVDTIELSDNSSDTVTATATGTSALALVQWNSTPNISDGSATFYLNTAGNPAGTTTVTADPQGTMNTLADATATVTKSGTVSSVAAASISITSPVNAWSNPANTTAAVARAVQVPDLTTSLTVRVDDTTANATGSTIRLAVYSSAGTVNGAAYRGTGTADDTLYIDLTTNSSRVATTTLTLGGAARVDPATITIQQVNVANNNVGSSSVVVSQKQPTIAQKRGISFSPEDSYVAALNTTIPVTVTVLDDTFGIPQTGYVVSVSRSNTFDASKILDSATTNASGVATVSVTNASTAVNLDVERYSFRIAPPAGASVNADNELQVTYTTGGGITTLSVAPSGSSKGSTVSSTTPSPTGWTAPLILTPGTDGLVGINASDDSYTVSTGVKVTTDPVYSLAQFTATADPQTNVTVTAPTGVKLSLPNGVTGGVTATTLYSEGVSTLTVTSGTPLVAWATKTGEHNITVTAGGKTVTFKVKAINNAARAYNLAVTPATQSVQTGAFMNVTVAVTDMFGNAVTTDDTARLTATTSGQVRISTGSISETGITTNASGLATVSLVASGTAGSGSVSVAPPSTTAVAAWQSDYVPPTGIAAPTASAVATVTVTAPPSPIPTEMTWGTVPTSIDAGASATLTATLTDQNGTVMDNADVNVTISGNAVLAGNGGKVGQYETNAEGKINVTVVAGSTGSFTVTATADGSTIATATTSSITITEAPTPPTPGSIGITPAGGGVVPTEVDAGAVVPMIATVRDTAGNPEALEPVEVTIAGDATFANGNKQYVANTGAAGTLGFTVVAGSSGSFTVTATVVSTPSVTATTGTITIVEPPVEPTITIVTAKRSPDNRRFQIAGTTTGFGLGGELVAVFRADGGTPVTTDPFLTNAAGAWSYVIRGADVQPQATRLRVQNPDGSVRSSGVVIAAAR